MRNLMTKEDIEHMHFYKLPKEFFCHPAYMSMKLESKIAYTMLVDLLPLSIKNNWVNEKKQVFVKLSRTKLMASLGIKGTQKAAQVMKELVDNNLIINKKIGLTQCNEIYLYPVEDSVQKKQEPKPADPQHQESKPQVAQKISTANLSAMPSLPAHSWEADMSEVKDLLENQIHTEELKLRYNHGLVDEIGQNIYEMFLNTTTRIGQQDKPMVIIRNLIRNLKMYHIEYVIDRFLEVTATVKIANSKKYLQTMIYNSMYEANASMVGSVRYQFGYY